MENMIKGDGWNKRNEAIELLASALETAASMAYGVNNCTVASSFEDAQGLLDSVRELTEELIAVTEYLEDEIKAGRGEASDYDDDEDY